MSWVEFSRYLEENSGGRLLWSTSSAVSPINTRRMPEQDTNKRATDRARSFLHLFLVLSSALTHTHTNMHYTTTHAGRPVEGIEFVPTGAVPRWWAIPVWGKPLVGAGLAIQRGKITDTSRWNTCSTHTGRITSIVDAPGITNHSQSNLSKQLSGWR